MASSNAETTDSCGRFRSAESCITASSMSLFILSDLHQLQCRLRCAIPKKEKVGARPLPQHIAAAMCVLINSTLSRSEVTRTMIRRT